MKSGLSLAGVALVTFVCFRVTQVNATTVGFAYLLLVLLIASTWGFLEAAVSSIAATLSFNFFFLPPVRTFTIADPENWVALFSFLTVSLVASRLSFTAKRRALDAIERQQEVERLYSFSRAILLIGGGEPFARQMVQHLAETFELSAVVLFDRRSGEYFRAGPLDFEGLDEQLREAAAHGSSFSDTLEKRVISAVRLGAEPIASLGLQGERMPDAMLQGIANLVAIGLERARAQDLANQVEAARQSEELRTTLIDAMAHEFKTPLTSIKAATTALLANPEACSGTTAELLNIADEEAERLKNLIDDAVEMARLDTSRIDVRLEFTDLRELVNSVAAAVRAKAADRGLEVVCDSPLPAVPVDVRLVKLALSQLLDNAMKYSPPGMPVRLHAADEDGVVILEVTDCGEGISTQEQSKIFQRFYRSPRVRSRIPGTGLGLSIAYQIAQAHRGDLTVVSHSGETTFRLTLPKDPKGGES